MSRIIFINRYFYPDYSATSQLLSDLAFELAQSGSDVHVITSRQKYDQPDAMLLTHENIRSVKVHRVWTSRFGRANLSFRAVDYLTFYLSAGFKLLVLAMRGAIIVAKTDPPLIAVVAAIVAKIRGAYLINWIQDLFPEVARTLPVGGIERLEGPLRSVRNWSLKTAFKNVVIGDGMASKLIAEGVMPNAIQLIPNWADGCAIQPIDTAINNLRQEWGLGNVFVVGYSGNMGRAHEFHTILDAAEILQKTTDIIFLFIGDGAQRNEIEEESRRKGLENIMFKPYQPREQLAYSLSVPDVHLISLQPSLEGLIVPSKFYGILAAGRPSIFIGSKNGEIPGIVQEAQCGFSVEIGQSEEISRIISELVSHKEMCINLGRQARTLFDKRFDMRHAMQAWKAIIASTASSKLSVKKLSHV